jgi:tape measure domain-containing protein
MSLNSAAFVSGLERATKATNRASSAIEMGMGRAGQAVKGFAAVFAADKAIDGARRYLEVADASKKMDAQMKLSTATFGNQGVAMRDVSRIAKETRSSMSSISDLYAKFMPTSKELGRSQLDNARAVETFSKAMKVGGADTQAQMSATLQMGQALSGTNVQWEELGAIMDASPRLTRLFTESLGVTRGELKKMAEDGKLTSKMLYDALTNTKMTTAIDAEFRELPKTFADSVTLIENGVLEMVGAFDRGAGISDAIVGALGEGEDAMGSLSQSAEDAGIEIRAQFAGLHDAFAPMGEGAANVFNAIRIDAANTQESIGNILRLIDKAHNAYAAMDNIGTDIENGVKRVANRMIDRAGGGQHFQEAPRIADWNMGDNYDRGYQRSRLAAQRKRVVRGIQQNGGDKYRGFTGSGMTDAQVIAISRQVIADHNAGRNVVHGTGRSTVKPPAAKGGGKGKGGGSASHAADKAQREAERAAETQRRNTEAYQADLNRSNREELDTRADLASVGAERFQFERQLLDQDRKTRLDQIDKDGPQGSKRYTAAQVTDLKAIEDRITANRSQVITLKEQEFQQQEALKLASASLANAEEMAQLDSNMARTAKDRRASEYRLLDLRMQQEKLALDAIIASRDATEAEKEIARRRLALLPALATQGRRNVDQQTQGPMGTFLDQIPRTAEEINEALQGVEVEGLQSLQNGLVDCVKGVGNLGDAFGNMADAVIDGLLRIALQQMLIEPLGNLLFGGGSGSGGSGIMGSLIGSIGGLFGGKTGKANGGMGNRGRYLVGERGPEVLDIGSPFAMTPNHKLDGVRGSGGTSVNVNFGAITSNDPAAVKQMAMQAIMEAAPMITENAKNHTIAQLQRPRL